MAELLQKSKERERESEREREIEPENVVVKDPMLDDKVRTVMWHVFFFGGIDKAESLEFRAKTGVFGLGSYWPCSFHLGLCVSYVDHADDI